MFFGLTNSPATFQTLMDHVLKKQIHSGRVVVYIDDILIMGHTKEEVRKITLDVLQTLADNDLFVKPEKCLFEVPSVPFLGVIVDGTTVQMEKNKVTGIVNWPAPKTVKELQAFLGLANYYRRFIKRFADVANPLHALLKKDIQWFWNERQQTSFDTLKKAFTTTPVLTLAKPKATFQLKTDASGVASGAVLSTLAEDNKWHPVAFYSKSFSQPERAYDIHDREMLAIIRALKEWRHFLAHTTDPFDILTDHRNLTYFMTSKKLNPRQARWAIFLQSFNFILKYVPAAKMGKADALSQRADHGADIPFDHPPLLPPERIHFISNESPIIDQIRKHSSTITDLSKETGTPTIHWSEDNGLFLYNKKIFVPEIFRPKILQLAHDSPIAGHPGFAKTLEIVSRDY